VLRYNGSTGLFLQRFCRVPTPRGLRFHYHDLYITSHTHHNVYRYNAATATSRGVYIEGLASGYDDLPTMMKSPWDLVFNKDDNSTLVVSQARGQVYQYQAPSQGIGLASGQKARFDRVWSDVRVNSASGIALTVDSLYVTGPFAAGIVRFNRTNGKYMHHFEDESLQYPSDVKEYKDYLYVANKHQIRKYNRLNGEFIRVHSVLDGMVASHMLFHTSWRMNMGA